MFDGSISIGYDFHKLTPRDWGGGGLIIQRRNWLCKVMSVSYAIILTTLQKVTRKMVYSPERPLNNYPMNGNARSAALIKMNFRPCPTLHKFYRFYLPQVQAGLQAAFGCDAAMNG